ncbi:MAG: queuosine precursor transporter [Parcubacteria group bacterium]|nr:queuosine precursor transporter [Parcubacteria group bacterium]
MSNFTFRREHPRTEDNAVHIWFPSVGGGVFFSDCVSHDRCYRRSVREAHRKILCSCRIHRHGIVHRVFFLVACHALTAFLIAQYQDVLSFFFFREKLGARFFWLRSLLSNLWSQLLDTTIFMVMAFAGLYSTHTLINIIISWWLYKVAMGALYTPLSYVGIYFLREHNEEKQSTT